MNGRNLLLLWASVLLTSAASAQQQPATNVRRIAMLVAVSSSNFAARAEAFRQGLRDVGYEEGGNIAIVTRYAEGKLDRLPTLANELVSLKPAVIVTAGGQATRAVKRATQTIPVVMTNDPDPVGSGIVASLARPGGNITGLANLTPELSGKRLELLSEVIPRLSRVAIFGTSSQEGHARTIKELDFAAKAIKTQTQYFDATKISDVETAFRAAVKERDDAALTLTSPILRAARARVAEFAVKYKLPTIYNDIQFVEAGGLLYYGVSFYDLDRHAAIYVDKILKGAKPADLPVEQPKKFDFVVNLKAAKQIGLTIPPNVLVRADRVIK